MEDAQGNTLGQWTYFYPLTDNLATGSIQSLEGDYTVTKFVVDTSQPQGCNNLDAGQITYQLSGTQILAPSSTPPGTPLSTTTKAYNFYSIPEPPGASTARESQTITTWGNNTAYSELKGYAPGISFGQIICNYQGQDCGSSGSNLVPIGGPTSTTYYDYNGAVLKEDEVTYEWQANSNYLAANILDIPATTETVNAQGTVEASTSYSYDLTPYSPGGGIRGHLTKQTDSLNTNTSASPTTYTGWNTATNTGTNANGNGMKAYFIDALGNTNSNGHTIDYQYGACNASVVTSTTNALNQSVSGIYDCNTGLLTSYVDLNGNTTTIGANGTIGYDNLRRLTAITYPSILLTNGQTEYPVTNFVYSDSANTVTKTVQATPDPNQVTQVIFDAVGREIHHYTGTSPSLLKVDTTYDSDGRVQSASNPYITTSDSTYGLTQYAYDALSRKKTVTHPDSSTLTWNYTGPVTDLYDELNHHTQQTVDGLGRLIQVMEPDPVTGVLDLQTNYGYDPLGNLINVNQLGNPSAGDSPRPRSFNYDSLSRLLCASNPENSSASCPYPATTGAYVTGTTGYAYDANSNLQQKTSPAQNGATGTAVVGYCYDKLNRMTNKFYSAPSCTAPTGGVASYIYDSSTASGASNTVGHLTSETVLNGTTALSQRLLPQYDKMGHLIGETQCPYGTCSSPYAFNYAFNLAGQVDSSNSGLPSTSSEAFTYLSTYDPIGRLANVSATNSSGTSPIFQAVSYGAFGLTAANLGGTTSAPAITQSRTYSNRGWTLSETDLGQAQTNAATNSQGTIAISGTEGQITGPATPGKATVTVTGADGTHTSTVCGAPYRIVNGIETPTCIPETLPDTGTIAITVNGFLASAIYGGTSTDAELASLLTTALNASGTPVTATSSGATITITSIAPGPSSNYSLSVSNSTDFSGTDSGSTLAGGAVGSPIYDAGTVTVTIDSTTATASWTQGSTVGSLASAIATAINTAAGSILTASTSSSSVILASKATGSTTDWLISVTVTDSNSTNFPTPSFTVEAAGMSDGTSAASDSGVVYSYSIPATNGYAVNGNVLSYTDSVMGTWTFGPTGYDYLNRLVSGTPTSGPYLNQNGCWSYDSFGNRTGENVTDTPCSSITQTAHYNTNNQVIWAQTVAPGGFLYDAAGNVLNDGVNKYLYDGENRLCAVEDLTTDSMTGYLYDAGGMRVAKGLVATMSTCPAVSGFSTVESDYLVDQGSNQVTEVNGGTGLPEHTNVWAGSKLLATSDSLGFHFPLTDWLGTKRIQANELGIVDLTCVSLPYGNGPDCVGDNATEHRFTSKERDTESGNDYFEARYYGSSMGRFMSPDPSGLLAQHPEDPQSWNLYVYARNNPLINIDPNGLDCIYATNNGKGVESIDHDSNSGECGQNGGTWLSGYVDEDWAHYNKKAGAFEAAGEDDNGQVNFAQFQAGAQTNDAGNCLSGCGSYGFASASGDWLTGQLVGNSRPTDGSDPLDGLLTFMTSRDKPVSDFWKVIAGPLNGKDNWAGPNGMGPPTGTGDWRAAVHDYNWSPGTNHLGMGSLLNPFLSLATSRALIQSNQQLMKTGGFQGAKEKLVFGPVNAFQWYADSWK